MKTVFACLLLSCLSFALGEEKSRSDMNYSQFQLVYSYGYEQTGNEKYYKIIRYLASQHRLSLKVRHYIYYYNGNYYIFHRYPVTDIARVGNPIIVSEVEAKKIMTR